MTLSVRFFVLFCLAILLAACVSAPPQFSNKPDIISCQSFYAQIDIAVRKGQKEDAQFARIKNFPWLRTSRFLASFRNELTTSEDYKDWLAAANRLAQQALFDEFALLPTTQQALMADFNHLSSRLESCGVKLVEELAGQPRWRKILLQRAQVKPDYRYWQRFVGFYPLTAIPFRQGIVREHQELAMLEKAFEDSDNTTNYHVYQPARQTDLQKRFIDSSKTRFPNLATELQRQLLAGFAPAVAIERLNQNNKIGKIRVSKTGDPSVDVETPVIYGWVDYGRYRDASTVRLNYSFWFARRPRQKAIDLLAGELDGLIWRVHLSLDGTVMAWDSVHSCGCWYRIYPSRNYRITQPKSLYREPVYVGKALASVPRKTLYLQPDTHHIVGVRDNGGGGTYSNYILRPYRDLKHLPAEDGVQSLFNRTGIVPVSRRAERFLFWPMGVPGAGAMRVAGSHAIAFVGTRHFDDAYLLEEIGLEPGETQ